jgi:hypothetical protein
VVAQEFDQHYFLENLPKLFRKIFQEEEDLPTTNYKYEKRQKELDKKKKKAEKEKRKENKKNNQPEETPPPAPEK